MGKNKIANTTKDLFGGNRTAFVNECRTVARKLLKQRPCITIDDVREYVQLPEYMNPLVFSQVFRDDEFETCGYTVSERRASKARLLCKWRRKEQ